MARSARECRPRRLSLLTSLSLLAVLSSSLPSPSHARATPSCTTAGTSWCIARRFPGSIPIGELGFRFGEPLDVDGDGRADVAAGARFKLWRGNQQNGTAAVWSGADGALIREWDGEWPDGLLGHAVTPIPDLSGDGLADVLIAAPHGGGGGAGALPRGVVMARSPKTGAEIWRRVETESENLGWDMALADDEDGDGMTDVFVGAPGEGGVVYLLRGKDGTVLRTYAPGTETRSFGWYLARLDDLDGDGKRDLAVGAPFAALAAADGPMVGAAVVLSSASGKELFHWKGTDHRGGFGGIVAAAGDLDHDGKGEIAVAAPGTEDPKRGIPGELRIYSGKTGKQLRHWTGKQPGELFGRMIVAAGDLDGDGVGDLAIGAPWHRVDAADHVGRVELRSGRTGKVLAELFGDEADCWFGWHMVRAPDPDGLGRPTLLVASLRHPVDGRIAVGVLDLLVLRRPSARGHGTMTRGARRSAIK